MQAIDFTLILHTFLIECAAFTQLSADIHQKQLILLFLMMNVSINGISNDSISAYNQLICSISQRNYPNFNLKRYILCIYSMDYAMWLHIRQRLIILYLPTIIIQIHGHWKMQSSADNRQYLCRYSLLWNYLQEECFFRCASHIYFDWGLHSACVCISFSQYVLICIQASDSPIPYIFYNQQMSGTSLGEHLIKEKNVNDFKTHPNSSHISMSASKIQNHYKVNLHDQIKLIHFDANYYKIEKVMQDKKMQSNKYYGEVDEAGMRKGFGGFIFPDNTVYIGHFKNGEINGMGIFHYNYKNYPSDLYIGETSNGKFDGYGKYARMQSQSDGYIIYEGNFVDGQKSGKGIGYFNNGQMLYFGSWKGNLQNGEGLFIKEGELEYKGSWVNGRMEGIGILQNRVDENSRVTYKGQWVKGQLNQGEITYLTKDKKILAVYRGEILSGLKHGRGVYNWVNSKLTFDGVFEEDRINGSGILKSPFWQFTGFFNSSQGKLLIEELQAVIKYQNGDEFKGNVSIVPNPKKDNSILVRKNGLYRFANGDQAEGTFNDDGSSALKGDFTYKWKETGQQQHMLR